MRIEGPSPIRGPAKNNKKKEVGADQGFSSMIDETPESSAPATSAPIAQTSMLLSLQEVDEKPENAYEHAKKHGLDMLDYLDAIRIGLLTGEGVSKHTLQSLQSLLQATPDAFQDPELAQIMGEIEVRAAVELAKIEYAAEQVQKEQ